MTKESIQKIAKERCLQKRKYSKLIPLSYEKKKENANQNEKPERTWLNKLTDRIQRQKKVRKQEYPLGKEKV